MLVREERSPVCRFTCPEDAALFFGACLESCDREQFMIASMNTKNVPTGWVHTVSIGSLSSSIVHPRETFKAAILANAAAIILAHNHPSGNVDPSQEDINATTRLYEAGKILGIDVLDHVIIGRDGCYFSFAENGLVF